MFKYLESSFSKLVIFSGHVIPIDGGSSKTQWHVSPTDGDLQDVNDVNQHQGQNLLKTSASRVWEEMYFNKKSAIEDVSKVYFPYSIVVRLEPIRQGKQDNVV